MGSVTVEAEDADPTSTLNLYRTLVRDRKKLSGAVTFIDSGDSNVMIFARNEGFHCIINTGMNPYQLSNRFPRCEVMVSSDMQLGDKNKVLPPNCAVWFIA